MKDRFDEKTEDLYIWISHEEIKAADSVSYGHSFDRLTDNNKKVAFLVDRVPVGIESNSYLDVNPVYDQGENQDWTLFHIRINQQAWEDLKQNKFATSRYQGPIGSEKVTILAGDPDIEGLDALRR